MDNPKIDVKKIEAFLLKEVHLVMGILVFMSLVAQNNHPKWLKDCPPIGGRRNGAWRGKGSFGKSFGPNRVRHK